jgi:hypothetical protein
MPPEANDNFLSCNSSKIREIKFKIMKTLKLIVILTLTFILFFAGCVISITINDPVIPSDQPSLIKLIAFSILGI